MTPVSSPLDPDPSFCTKTSWIQFGYGVWVNLTMVGIGLNFGFTAVAIPQLQEPGSSIVITTDEKAMITSMLNLSSPVGCLLCGVIMDRFGRTLSLVLSQAPIAFGWFYMGMARSANDIIVGRVITGFGIGMCMTAPRAYITEITLPNMRGLIGAMPSLATSIGLTIQATLGAFFKWRTLCYLCGLYALTLLCCNYFLPDTPYYLILKATEVETRKALAHFRSPSFNIDAELKELKEFKDDNDIHSLTTMETAKALFRPSVCKPFGIIMFYTMLTQFVGANVIVMWTVEILQNAKSSVDPNLGNVILGWTRIVVGIVASWILFKVGRRPMALLSAVGLGVVCISLAMYLHKHTTKSVIPQCFFMAYVLCATLGYYTIPFLLMSELMPLQVRGIMIGVVLSSVNLAISFMNQIYPTMVHTMGFENTFVMYGVISLLGAIVLYFILPETIGLTLQEIEEYFNDRRPTLVSQRRVMAMQLKGVAGSNQNFKPNQYPRSSDSSDASDKNADKKHKQHRKSHHSRQDSTANDDVDEKRKQKPDEKTKKKPSFGGVVFK